MKEVRWENGTLPNPCGKLQLILIKKLTAVLSGISILGKLSLFFGFAGLRADFGLEAFILAPKACNLSVKQNEK